MAFGPWQDMVVLLGHVRVLLKSVLSVFFFFSPLFRRDSHCMDVAICGGRVTMC